MEKNHTRPMGVEFVFGATAAVGAGIFTNPIDVIKIRLQLQGELTARGTYNKFYHNTFHAAYVIAKYEGIRALQAGLGSALAFQVVLNGIRLGSFKLGQTYGQTLNEHGQTSIFKTAMLSGVAGCIGAVLGSPFYLVKTQIQAQSASSSASSSSLSPPPPPLAVGHQHGHTGEWSAFRSLWRTAGFCGLYQRWYANIPRVFVGSATQLTMFSLVSDWLKSSFPGAAIATSSSHHYLLQTFFSAIIGGSCVALTMQPFDVVATRLYNQGTDVNGHGLLYKNFSDAFVKILKTEGIMGLYKGTFPTWMRIAPHTVLCLCFYEQLEHLYDGIQ